jgi:hypothetical protein
MTDVELLLGGLEMLAYLTLFCVAGYFLINRRGSGR